MRSAPPWRAVALSRPALSFSTLLETFGSSEEAKRRRRKRPERPKITSRGVRTLRRRLRVTQADFAKLLGTAPHTVHLWEKKEGSLRLRDKTREALITIRGLGAREARITLGEMKGAVKRNKSLC